jgi:hypothetical protein
MIKTKFLTAEDDKVITDTVKSGYGPDRLYPYFKNKYPEFEYDELVYAIRRLALQGLRDKQGDPGQLLLTT